MNICIHIRVGKDLCVPPKFMKNDNYREPRVCRIIDMPHMYLSLTT